MNKNLNNYLFYNILCIYNIYIYTSCKMSSSVVTGLLVKREAIAKEGHLCPIIIIIIIIIIVIVIVIIILLLLLYYYYIVV